MLYRKDLERHRSEWLRCRRVAVEQVEMRLGYARRLARRLRQVKPDFEDPGHRLAAMDGPSDVVLLLSGETAARNPGSGNWPKSGWPAEQFEAYSNQQRGRDYYVHAKETLPEAFTYLDTLRREGLLSAVVVDTVQRMTAEGEFDYILEQARGYALSRGERRWLRRL